MLEVWPELLQRIQAKSRVAAASWEGSRPVAVRGGTLVVEVPSAGQAKSIASSGRDVMLRTFLIEGFGIDVTVSAVEKDTEQEPDSEPSDSDPDLEVSGLAGVELLKERLGATTIGEIEGG